MIIKQPLFRIRCKVGDSFKPFVLVAARNLDEAITEVQSMWADEDGYAGQPITPTSVDVVNLEKV